MSYYKRLSYMDYCEDGVKAGNAGFVKWTKLRNGREQLQLQITYYPVQDASCEKVTLCMDQCRIDLGRIEIQGRKGTLLVDDLETVIKSAGISCDHYSGMEIRIEIDPHRLLAASFLSEGSTPQTLQQPMPENSAPQTPQQEKVENAVQEHHDQEMSLQPMPENPVQQTLMQEKMENAVQEYHDQEMSLQPIPENAVPQTNTEMIAEEAVIAPDNNTKKVREQRQAALLQTRRMMRMHREKWQQLWQSFPHIRPFQDEREYLRLTLQDLIVLPKSSYGLAENSFLLHGYYNYEHLILTKLYKRGTEKYYIGVPGNYYIKEAQMAVLFGFESFEPKIEPAKEGDFGYYMIGVNI